MPATLDGKFATLQKETRDQWAAWAAAVADDGTSPSPISVLEAGAVLDIAQPMAALKMDADAILQVRALEEQAAAIKAAVSARLTPYGGEAGLRERMGELRRELARLQGLVGPEKYLHAGQLSGEASRLRAKHPRVFAAVAADARPAKRRAAK